MEARTLEATSNRQDWSEDRSLIDQDTGDRIDLSGLATITIELRDPESRSSVLSGTLAGGEVALFDSNLVLRWTFPASSMRSLSAKTYEVGMIATQDTETIQIILGTLPVLDGIVS